MPSVFQGEIYIRAAADDSTDFASGITAADFETAFPAATTKYSDSADGTELPGSASGEYTSANGIKVNPYTETGFSISLTDLTSAQKTALKALVGASVDICVKNSINGANDLGNGEVFRGYNLHSARNRTLGGIITFVITVDRKFPADKEDEINQEFDIIAET